jgi:phage gpG-like protein
MTNKFRLKEKSIAVDKAVKDMVKIAAKDAEVHFKKSFANEGFTDNTLERWQPRKGKINSLGAKAIGKKTLTKTGALRRSIMFKMYGGYSAIVYSNLPYSAIHNEGLTGKAWGKATFKMPKRKFLGNSRILEKRTAAKFRAKILTAFKNG